MKKWLIGMYLRLSADEKVDGESNSVANQKKLIEYFLLNKTDIKIYKVYIDDGYTGTDFNRPGYKEMINDIQKKKINGVIIKDLSRLGRNYIEVGNFIDEIVPIYKLRFISVNDNVDSFINPNIMTSLEIPFKNLMNESYSKDSSKKMRTALKASKSSGNYIGKIAPFGYLKDEDNCHRLIIDDEAAVVVKKIFDLALKGNSKQEIIQYLKNNNITTPSIYMKNKYDITVSKISSRWNTKMIDSILKNKTYTGSLVQNKRTRISHKTHNMVRVAEDDWIIYDNSHKAIIDIDVYEQVQSILYNRNVKVNKEGKFHKYTGFVKCSECGANLYRLTRIKCNKEQPYYYCSTYIKSKKCNKHYILESELDEIVKNSLNNFIDLVCNVQDRVDEVLSYSKIDYNEELKKLKLMEIEKKIKRVEVMLEELVKDYKCDIISEDDYDSFKQKYLMEKNSLNLEKEELNKAKINSYNLNWINNFKKLEHIETIDRNIVDSLIENIFVNDDKTVEIQFKFKNHYEDALRYLKMQDNVI